MNEVWWRKEPLSETEFQLLDAVNRAHGQCVFRANASSVAVAHTAAGSNDVGKAIMAGILTLGGRHAPLEETWWFLELANPAETIELMLKEGLKVPGWGGTFQKDEIDPLWEPVSLFLHTNWPEIAEKMDAVTAKLHSLGKIIQPNPSAFTAAAAHAIKLPAKLVIYLFISARLDAWVSLAFSQLQL